MALPWFLAPLQLILSGSALAQVPVRGCFCQAPAKVWQEALLSGNGKLGIMVFGDPLNENVIFDANFLHHPSTQKAYLPDISGIQDEVKQDCLQGKYRAGAKRQLDALLAGDARAGGEGARHAGYKMDLKISGQGKISGYSRACDFSTGVISVRWTDQRGSWVRESFVSREDNCAVQRLSAPCKNGLDCSIQLSGDLANKPSDWNFAPAMDGDFLVMRVKYQPLAGDQGYEGATRVVLQGGHKVFEGGELKITGARSVLLLTGLARHTQDCEKAFARRDIQGRLAALPADYVLLLKRHAELHGQMYTRVSLDLGGTAKDRKLSNEASIEKQARSEAPVKAFWERVFDAGRYYFLSASCEDTPPAGVGVWTGDFNPEWGGFFHTDANLNLSVAGGNAGDLPEAMEGYFRLIEGWAGDWKYNATRILGCRGFLPDGQGPAGTGNGVESDLNIDWPYQYFTGRMGWLLYPFWEHYLATGDQAFLKDRLFPLLRPMGDFYEDFLKKTDEHGKFIFVGSISPENTPANSDSQLAINATIDIAAARFTLKTLIQACGILGLEQGKGQGRERWQAILDKLPPYLVNEDGALKEWAWPALKDNYNHRHISHLTTVWPFKEINAQDSPGLMAPALKALQLRGDEDGSGHSLLMRALVGAGLKEKGIVFANLSKLMKQGYLYSSLYSSHFPKGRVFWSDVIDALPAVMMEMLADSRPGRIELLPALPDELDRGTIKGLKTKSQVTIKEMAWDLAGKNVNVMLVSAKDQEVDLVCGLAGFEKKITLKAGEERKVEISIGR